MFVVGIDPGPVSSGYVLFDGANVVEASGAYDNAQLRDDLLGGKIVADAVVIERVQFYGKLMGPAVFDTIWWGGRFFEAGLGAGMTVSRVYWNDVKRQFVGAARVDDKTGKKKKITESDVRLGVIERFGGRAAALGSKKAPGPCAGVRDHAWSALALTVYWWDKAHSGGVVAPLPVAQEQLF
jgi:hypothetical protein